MNRIQIILPLLLLIFFENISGSKITFIPDYKGPDKKYRVYTIITKVRHSTSFEFPPGTEIESLVLGDREYWTGDCDGRKGYIKPLECGIETSLHIVTTSGETYAFELIEQSTLNQPDIYSRVIIKPFQPVQLIQKISKQKKTDMSSSPSPQKRLSEKFQFLKNLNHRYSIHKNNFFNVIKVYDDQIMTYIHMDNPQFKPAVFLISKKQKPLESLQYSEENSIYLVHRVLEPGEKFLLKVGKNTTFIKREPEKK